MFGCVMCCLHEQSQMCTEWGLGFTSCTVSSHFSFWLIKLKTTQNTFRLCLRTKEVTATWYAYPSHFEHACMQPIDSPWKCLHVPSCSRGPTTFVARWCGDFTKAQGVLPSYLSSALLWPDYGWSTSLLAYTRHRIWFFDWASHPRPVWVPKLHF